MKCCRWARVRKTCVYRGFEYCLASPLIRASESQAVKAGFLPSKTTLKWKPQWELAWELSISTRQPTLGLKAASKWIKSSSEQTPGMGRFLLGQWSINRKNRAKSTEKCCSVKERGGPIEDLKEEQWFITKNDMALMKEGPQAVRWLWTGKTIGWD